MSWSDMSSVSVNQFASSITTTKNINIFDSQSNNEYRYEKRIARTFRNLFLKIFLRKTGLYQNRIMIDENKIMLTSTASSESGMANKVVRAALMRHQAYCDKCSCVMTYRFGKVLMNGVTFLSVKYRILVELLAPGAKSRGTNSGKKTNILPLPSNIY